MTVKMFIMITIDKNDIWMIILCALIFFGVLKKNYRIHDLMLSFILQNGNSIIKLAELDQHLIGSLTAEHKAIYSFVFSDIKYRQNIAGR